MLNFRAPTPELSTRVTLLSRADPLQIKFIRRKTKRWALFSQKSKLLQSKWFICNKPVVEELLHVPPLGPALPALEPPVVHEHVVQNQEPVACHVHLVGLKIQRRHCRASLILTSVWLYLRVSGHTKANESLIEGRCFTSGHIKGFILAERSSLP